MLKKLISLIMGATIFLSAACFPVINAAFSDISMDLIFDEEGYGAAADIKNLPPPSEFPISDKIKDLDGSVIKILIDPGHFSNYNQSPVYPVYWESHMTWKLSNYLQQELQALGVHADLTKKSLDDDPALNDRGFMSKGYDLFLSVHSNATNNTTSDQPLAFVYQQLSWTDIDDISADVGKLLADTTTKVMGTTQKGAITRRKGDADHDKNGALDDEWYSVLFGSRYVGTPGILMEHSFHTNYRSAVWLYNEDNLKKLAKEEAKVIYEYFRKKKEAEYPVTTTTTTTAATTTTTTMTTTTTTTVPVTTVTRPPVPEGLNLGDVNNDRKVDASDAALVLKHYAYLSTTNEETGTGAAPIDYTMLEYADTNADGLVDASDAADILCYYSYLSTGGYETDMRKWILIR
ncbi:MAG: N-acetylmuramoyl-L-alanine amidase [Alistipes sp.]|nr:N-acetylmuramoyl-L-alanine amidase [Alistipes sp.]